MPESPDHNNTDGDLFFGIDVGSETVKAALCHEDGSIVRSWLAPTRGRPLATLRDIVNEATRLAPATHCPAGATGAGKHLLESFGVPAENEIIATARAAAVLAPEARDIIEVGAQFTKWLHLDETGAAADYATNDLCAAGCGSFIEQQASRLHVSVEELAQQAVRAPQGATIAGRCSVFAKSDMIHLQQKGVAFDELAYGLCLAVARNFAGAILRARTVTAPVAFIGGGAANPGLVRAFRQVLELGQDELFVPSALRHFGAVGAGLTAAVSEQRLTLHQLQRALANGGAAEVRGEESLPPLKQPAGAMPREEPAGVSHGPVEAFLGVDVGSVSTDFALLAPDGALIDSVYLATRGRPLDVLAEGLAALEERYGARLTILGVGATGSGRYLASAFLGADVVKNEITAQLTSAAAYFPDVDTIFEIGGQDSKYIRSEGAAVRDFTMNKICAAGTGSFLEEQAERLGISIIGQFADLALAGDAPVDLGNRCTVFIDSELSFAQQRGVPIEDITAGLAFAVARNYLEKVVAGRPVGARVVFQGGVASNRAVVAAFESILGRFVEVHPYNRVSGAIGAALLARDAMAERPAATQFSGFDMLRNHEVKTFECTHCTNRCQVKQFRNNGKTVYFGDTCERFSGTKRPASGPNHPDLASEWAETGSLSAVPAPLEAPRGVIGIPRASLFYELMPLWMSFLHRLGYRTELSAPSSPELFAKGLRALPVETCLPIKLTFGHVLDLGERGVDPIFLPSVRRLPAHGCGEVHSAPCIYAEHAPFMANAAASAKLLAPAVALEDDLRVMGPSLDSLSEALDVPRRAVAEAFRHARDDYRAFIGQLETRGNEVLAGEFDRAFVLIGHPYSLFDPFQNLDLARHLRRLGVLAIPMPFLPLSTVSLGPEWNELQWKFNRDYVRAAEVVRGDPRLFPVVLSNFGCGPDGFTLNQLDVLFEGRPRLYLEFDEHRGEAGLVTRLEAFLDEVDAHQRAQAQPKAPQVLSRGESELFPEGRTVFVPYFADHAYAFAGALRAAGRDARVLPPPGPSTEKAGRQFSTGRECHPYVMMAGDLIALMRSGQADDGDVFFFPGAMDFPCLLSQFRRGYEHIRGELGEVDLDITAPPLSRMFAFLGVSRSINLWRGLLATDFLTKLACERRPYECERGAVNRAQRLNLEAIQEAVARDRVLEAVEACIARLDAVPVRRETPRPVVGVAGDLYTRINEFSNDGLFARLEALGCEVWPSPFIVEDIDFALRKGLGQSVTEKRIGQTLGASLLYLLKEFNKKRVRDRFDGLLRDPGEPGYGEVLRHTAPYAHPESNFVVLLNIAKLVDFAERGADGVVNAMGFNCMVGTVSAALLQRIRADHGGIPIVNLVYGETESVGQRTRLEAFVHQVKVYAGRGAGRTAASSAV